MQTPHTNRICALFGIRYPIVQAGMIWCSGWRLAAAVSEAGGLGIIGSGSMYPDVLRHHIRSAKAATDKPFGVNVPLLYPSIKEHMAIIREEGVRIVFTSAGNPKTWTAALQADGITVVHVVPSASFAVKAEAAGVDAVVCEGFEAGGHNGRDETTSLVLIPMVRDAVRIPLLAAGGIGSGRSMLAAMVLGAEGVQIGSRFAASAESSAHERFKQAIVDTPEGGTMLSMKALVPVRLIRNVFQQRIAEAEARGADVNELAVMLGRARAKLGMFEGDLDEGELEIGQISGAIRDILPASDILRSIVAEFEQASAAAPGLRCW
jgi:enoyl-[acyl-carrier protein] reductase II